MKKGIHPEYKKMEVICACKKHYLIGGTKDKIEVEVCWRCHPIFTGSEETKAIIGQVEKFHRRYKRPKKT